MARLTLEEIEQIKTRRKHVENLRFQHGLTMFEIHAELAKLNPPIIVSLSSVKKDVGIIEQQVQRDFLRKFDPVSYVASTVRTYEIRAAKLHAAAEREEDGSAKATLFRAANECNKLATEILQDIGLVDKKVAAMILFAGKPGEEKQDRPISALQIRQALLESKNIIEGSLVSEGEAEMLEQQEQKRGVDAEA